MAAQDRPVIGCTAGTYDAQRQCARTGIGFEESPPLPRVSFATMIAIGALAVIGLGFAAHGIADRTDYAASQTVAQER